ncbi:MAG: hypothetical protein JKX94_03055 [Sneathiella sp.]|nr:hypothetical protein [Sneathiella sp.]
MVGREEVKPTKPRKPDKRLWDSLSEDQDKAARQIYYGFKLLVGETGFRTQGFSGMPRMTSNRYDGSSDLVEKYRLWARSVCKTGVSVHGVIDILIFGKSCREVDRELRKRKGFAKKNLLAGLGFFLDL